MSHSRPIADSRSYWIISPTWDLACLVATPLAIVPAIWGCAAFLATPEQIDLVVAAFASFAHHLPGFMRCYGDRDLFSRFKWRFLLAPPILLGISWAFALSGLHGLTLVLLIWGTWHGLMQTYGFMRIYDLKRGIRESWDGRLDFALCFAIFAAGMVFSDARAYGIAAALWQSGLPTLAPFWLTLARWIVGAGTAGILVVYAFHVVRRANRSAGVSWAKLLLAATTGWLFWTAGTLTTNLLVGVAMFETFHAIQYYAIVWTYNRRLAQRAGAAFGPLGFLFQDRWLLVGTYLGAIFAYGSIRYFGAQLSDPLPQKLLVGLIGASSLLHFYFDGFIWKVRERKTQLNLDIESGPAASSAVPARLHIARWGVLMAVLLGLFGLEKWQSYRGAITDEGLVASLSAWTPRLPEVQSLVSQAAVQRGDPAKAIAAAREAVKFRQRSYKAHATLGVALLAGGQPKQAEDALREAVRLAPRQAACFDELARALLVQEKYADAEQVARQGLAFAPGSADLQAALGRALLGSGRPEASLEPLQKAIELNGGTAGSLLALGVAHLLLNQHDPAEACLTRALDLEPGNADVQFQLGNLYHATGRLYSAVRRYERCAELRPDYVAAYSNLGVSHFDLQQWPEAAAAFRRALELDAEEAQLHYNLGLCLLELNDRDAAREQVRRSIELGHEPPPELLQQLELPVPRPSAEGTRRRAAP